MTSEAAGSRRWRFALLLIVFLACALRATSLTAQSLWRDEVDAIRFASRDLPALLANFRRSGENGPLYFLILRYWWPLFPTYGQPVSPPASDYALRFFSVIPGIAAVPLAAILARRLLSWQAGMLAALLVTTAPYLVWYSQEGKMYALVTALVLAALLALEAAIRRGRAARWFVVWLFTTVAAYVHIMALLLIPVGITWFLLAWPRARARWLGGLATLAGLTLPYIPIALWQVRLLFWPRFRPGFPYVPLTDMAQVLLVAFSRGVPPTSLWTLTPFLFSLLAGLGLEWAGGARSSPPPRPPPEGGKCTSVPLPLREGPGEGETLPASEKTIPDREIWPDRRAIAALAVWLVLPVVGLWLISLRVPLFVERYLIWTAPAFLILVAQGLVAVWRRSRPVGAIALVAVLLLNGQALWIQATTPIKSDFRAAAAFVAAHWQPGDLIIFLIPYSRFTFAHYYGDPAPWGDAPFTNDGLSAEETGARLARLTNGYAAAWLVTSEGEMWDRRGLVLAWLAAHGEIGAQADFTSVRVARYDLR